MNPIPTTNAMKPAPGKGVSSFPTPVIKDTVIVEIVNAWKGDYQPLEYGTKWDDVPHASVQGSFPDHKLINQSPNSEDGQWVKRIWANDRVDQDTYNYAIKYSGGSDAHPIYIRTYVELREGYAPVKDLSPDPLFPGAFLVEEEVQRQEDELDSRYVKVIRTYETLNGPIISSQRITERGDLETIEVQQVFPDAQPDPDGLFVTQTQVLKEDVSKGTKTTARVQSYSQLLVKETKEGLLGITETTDNIVAPSAAPDQLSQTIVSSVVQQTSATKAVKRTTTSSGPFSLTQKSTDGKLLGNITVTESIVPPNSSPDIPSGSDSGILSSEVKQIDSGKAIKRNTVLNSTPTLTGKSFREGLLGETTTTESVVSAGANPDSLSQEVVSSVVEPIDLSRSRKITVTSNRPTSLSKKSKDGKLLGDTTTTQSIVDPNQPPDSITFSTISSEVNQIDSGKAVKTNVTLNSTPTFTGNQTGEGLLGTRTTTETVVPVGTPADPVSETIISSSVEPLDSHRSRKTTVESNGPTSLTGEQNGEGLLGQSTIVESIVAAGTPAENLDINVVSSRVDPIDEAKSKLTTVIRKPITLSGERINERGDKEVTEEKIVSAGSSAQSPTFNIVSSDVQPIDSGKSKETTTRIDEYAQLGGSDRASGLLGKTSVIEEIVEAGSAPFDLTFDGNNGIIESTVTPISAQRSKRTTKTTVGPKELVSKTLVDSPLGLVKAKVTKEIVLPNTEAGPTEQEQLKLIKDTVEKLDESKSQREKIEIDSEEWPENVGVDYDDQLGLGIYYKETIVAPTEYTDPAYWYDVSNKNYKPIDQWKSLKREIDKEKVSDALLKQWYKIPINVDITLPDKLLDIKIYWGRSYGEGQSATNEFDVGSGSYGLSLTSRSKRSASINGDVYFNIEQGFKGTIAGNRHIFFIEIGDDGRVESEEILKILNNFEQYGSREPILEEGQGLNGIAKYKPWPFLQTRTENLVLITGGKSETENKSESRNSSINGFSSGTGSGSDIDVDVNARSILVPPAFHGELNLAQSQEFFGDTIPINLGPLYGVRPEILETTKVRSGSEIIELDKFPVGEYLYSSDVELYKWGFVKVTAITVNITESYV